MGCVQLSSGFAHDHPHWPHDMANNASQHAHNLPTGCQLCCTTAVGGWRCSVLISSLWGIQTWGHGEGEQSYRATMSLPTCPFLCTLHTRRAASRHHSQLAARTRTKGSSTVPPSRLCSTLHYGPPSVHRPGHSGEG